MTLDRADVWIWPWTLVWDPEGTRSVQGFTGADRSSGPFVAQMGVSVCVVGVCLTLFYHLFYHFFLLSPNWCDGSVRPGDSHLRPRSACRSGGQGRYVSYPGRSHPQFPGTGDIFSFLPVNVHQGEKPTETEFHDGFLQFRVINTLQTGFLLR